MGNAELIKALRCKEYFDLCKDTSCKYYVGDMRSGCHCEIKVKEYAGADALEMADAKLHEQDLRIADLVAHLNAEQARVARLVAKIERLKAENCNMCENSVSHEVYMRVCAEREKRNDYQRGT